MNSKRQPLVLAFVTQLLFACLAVSADEPTLHDIRRYGAVADGETVCTEAIQKAIDQCSRTGGGVVLVAGGQYVTGTIHMKSHVTLRVEAGAELLGSTKIADYAAGTHKNMYKNEPHMDRCLIFAKNATGFAIEGNGIINGRGGEGRLGQPGHKYLFPNKGDPKKYRPMLIRFVECSRIRMRDITLKNPAAWTSAWLYCDDIVVDGITISSRVNHNGDGLDFDGCKNVRVSNSAFDTSDDSICLQASRKDQPCENVTITNCIFISKWAGIRIGLLSLGDFNNVTVSDCVFRDIDDSGLKIQMCEGGAMKNMVFSNLVMQNVPRPIFMTFCQQRACVDSPEDQLMPMNQMKGFVFDGIRVDSSMCGADSAIMITGMPGHSIEDVLISDLQLVTGGGGDSETGGQRVLNEMTPEVLEGWWPEYVRFGKTVPTHGIYARHVDGLTLNNVQISSKDPDARPAIVCDDVAHLDINAVSMRVAEGAESDIRLQAVSEALIRNCHASGDSDVFVLVDREHSRDIVVSDSNRAKSKNSFKTLRKDN